MAATTTYYGLFAKSNLDESQTLYSKSSPGATTLTAIANTSIREFLNSASGSTETAVEFQQHSASFSKEEFYLHFIDGDQEPAPVAVNDREIGRIKLFKGSLKSIEAIEAKLFPSGEDELAELDPSRKSQEEPTGSRPADTDTQSDVSSLFPNGEESEELFQRREGSTDTHSPSTVNSVSPLIDLTRQDLPPSKAHQPSLEDLGKNLANLPKKEATPPLKGRSRLSYALFGLAGAALIVSTGFIAQALPINRATLQVWKSAAA